MNIEGGIKMALFKINGHSRKELEQHNAGDYITNPEAIKEDFPIEVYYKSKKYWDSSWIKKFNSETCISACDGYDYITEDMEIYLSTNKDKLKYFKENH